MARSYSELMMKIFKYAPTYIRKTQEKFNKNPNSVKKSKRNKKDKK